MLDRYDYDKQLDTEIANIGRIRGYRDLSNAPAKIGKLDPKIRELIALAVGVTRQCPRLHRHATDAAIKDGATREEIVEAQGVAMAVNAGAAPVYSARDMGAYLAKKD